MKKSHLTLEQRYEIQAYLKVGKRPSEISVLMTRNRSVISREIKRNSSLQGKYWAKQAQQIVQIRKERYRQSHKMISAMQAFITEKLLQEQCSPKRKKGYADTDHIAMVSHEHIYQVILH